MAAVQPVNRYFSAEGPHLQPDLKCLVGMDSASVSELYKVNHMMIKCFIIGIECQIKRENCEV